MISGAIFRAVGAPELSIGEDEAGEIVSAVEAFAEAWFPDSDGLILPPRLTSAAALAAVLYSALQPRVAALRGKSRQIAAKRDSPAPAEQQSAPLFDTTLLQPLA